jgi:hypothetical protein
MLVKIKFPRLFKLIERENAVRYLMISLFSFVATVSVVRSFLVLTGYPQIGQGTLHIAHVLWGGLILYIAAILPLIYLNPRLHFIEAILSGIGMGLFLDEVGKFITREYDYFFPAAAPIMYVFFLLIVVLIIMIRRPAQVDGRSELVQALEIIREQLYRPLNSQERNHLEMDMKGVIENDPDGFHRDMAQGLLSLVQSDTRTIPDKPPAWWLKSAGLIERWLTEIRLSWMLIFGMLLVSWLTLKNPLQAWLQSIIPNSLLERLLQSHFGRQIASSDSPALSTTRISLELLIGILLLVSIGFFFAGKKRLAVSLAYFCLLASLVALDMLLFYFEQFSTVGTVLVQFLVLYGVISYRARFLNDSNHDG